MDGIGTIIIVGIILYNIFRSFRKATKDARQKTAQKQPTPRPQQQNQQERKGKLEDWLGDYLEQIEDSAAEQKKKAEAQELREEQSHSVFEKDAEEKAHYEEEREKHFKLREEKKKHKHSDLYKGKVNKDFFEERQRIAKSRKRIEATTDNEAFSLSKKNKSSQMNAYKFVARDAIIGSIIFGRYQDPMSRLEKF